MKKELTNSPIARQNILNNPFAVKQLEEDMQLCGRYFEKELVFTKQQVAEFLEIEVRTVERYIENYEAELRNNGYRLLNGNSLKSFKNLYLSDINVGEIHPKTPSLSIFSFRSLLNLAMLVTESEKARIVRSRILDIALSVISQKSEGNTTFINQRDISYLPSALYESNYRKSFTDSLKLYLDMGNFKYSIYTNKIYQVVFHENANEYKKILRLSSKVNARDTMYSEVLNAIASIESGLASEIKERSETLQRKLFPSELDEIFKNLENNHYLKPVIETARICMASRDLPFRDALHKKLENYIRSVSKEEYENFLGEKSKSLQEQLSEIETLNILKRLKDK